MYCFTYIRTWTPVAFCTGLICEPHLAFIQRTWLQLQQEYSSCVTALPIEVHLLRICSNSGTDSDYVCEHTVLLPSVSTRECRFSLKTMPRLLPSVSGAIYWGKPGARSCIDKRVETCPIMSGASVKRLIQLCSKPSVRTHTQNVKWMSWTPGVGRVQWKD